MEITISMESIKQFILMNNITRYITFHIFVLLLIFILILHYKLINFILINIFRIKNSEHCDFDKEAFVTYVLTPILLVILYMPIVKYVITFLIFS